MADPLHLDNPIWYALKTKHQYLDCGLGLAVRYPNEISRFAGLGAPTPEAFADLAASLNPGATVSMFTAEPLDVPPEWTVVRTRELEQMLCMQCQPEERQVPVELGFQDVAEMLALVEATRPGPFLPATIIMGRYLGIRTPSGSLVAMAGERLQLPDYVEISAVCTDPAFRGRGYAKDILSALIKGIFAVGCTPFLHVKTDQGAKGLYEALGFRTRRIINLTVMTRP